MEVVLPIPDGGRLTVALCPACHRDVFTPLITALIDTGQVGVSPTVAGRASEAATVR